MKVTWILLHFTVNLLLVLLLGSWFPSNFVCQRVIFHRLFVVVEDAALQRYRRGSGVMRTRHTKAPFNIDKKRQLLAPQRTASRCDVYGIFSTVHARVTVWGKA